MSLVLASRSPRRSALLERVGVRFEVRPADVPEEPRPGETAREHARRLARDKALTVAGRLGAAPPRWVLGADTVVTVDGRILGKPDDPEHAVAILSLLTGRCHEVVTAVALARSDRADARVIDVRSTVCMRRAPRDELVAYVATGEPLDKAGAYGAQGEGRRLIERIEGSESNVIGLPLDETLALLREAGCDAAPARAEPRR